jgi:hypothetical protein
MIKFFRKIRQNMLLENKNGTYFKYAIGEIVLVMIGILFALQVNEWNNERNREKDETVIIAQLEADLKKSQVELKDIIELMDQSAKASAIVCHAFWKKEIPNDSIFNYMLWPLGTKIYSPTLGTARSLINSGNITLLKSTELKNDITFYVEEVDYTLKDISRYEETYYRKGVILLSEVTGMGNLLTQESIKKRLESDDFATSETTRSDEYFSVPNRIEKIPFKTDLKQLFKNQKVYSAYRSLLVSHRNSSFKYQEILENTNTLLEKLQKGSN